MKIVYTAEPIQGRGPENPRQARENLIAVIEDCAIPRDLVKSYTVTHDDKFPFPFKKPNPLEMNGFFGKKPNYNTVAQELNELFDQPQREIQEYKLKLIADLKTATDQQILEMIEKFHYTRDGTKAKYDKAIARVRELWKPYDQIKNVIEAIDYNRTRSDLAEALAIIDDDHTQGLLEAIRETEKLLKSGRRKEAVKGVLHWFSDWERKNLAPLSNACGDAKVYGEGFWIARLVVPNERKESHDMYEAKTVEELLRSRKKPFQVVSSK